MKRHLILLSVAVALVFGLLAVPALAQDRPDLLIWADRTRTPPLTELAAAFGEEFGVTVEVQEIAMGDIRANLSVVGPTGEGPDIIVAAHDWIGELVINGAVTPIDLGDAAEMFTPGSLSLFTYNGEIYGMPYAAENVAFFRNSELVPDAPATWDDVRAITEELVDGGAADYGYIIQTADFYHFHPILSAFGGYIFGTAGGGAYDPTDVGVDSEGAVAAATWLEGMAVDGFIPPAIDYDVMHTLFERGDAAMIVTGPWALPRIRESGVPYAISNIPAGPAGPGMPLIGGQGFMLSAYSENQLLAESFLLDYVATDEAMQALYDADPRPPAFIPTLEKLNDPDLAAFQAAGEVGIPQPSIPEMSSVWGSAQTAMQLVIQGDQPAADAFADAAEQIRTLIAGGEVETVRMTPAGDPPPADGPQSVSIPGTVNSAIGCGGDWDPACEDAQLAYVANSDVWMGTFLLPAGDYEYKVALDGAWTENYGGMADRDGPNVALSVAEEGAVMFVYDHKSHWVADSVNHVIASVPGNYQAAIGCAADWSPDCLRSWLQDPDGDGVYTLSVTLPAGDYEGKVAYNLSWDENYGADGARDGANLTFSVPAEGVVTFSFDPASHVLTIAVGG
ncbi:MAG: extracellular solute-binding protein [Anaerolineae bacterium]|nr:extracellular solute-binding protein [Anaerolineae bacterium]